MGVFRTRKLDEREKKQTSQAMDSIPVIHPFPEVLLELFCKSKMLVNEVYVIQINMPDLVQHRNIPYSDIPRQAIYKEIRCIHW